MLFFAYCFLLLTRARCSGAVYTRCIASHGGIAGALIHDALPCPPGHLRVVRDEVGAAKCEIEGRLPLRLVFRPHEFLRVSAVLRSEASAICGAVFLPVKDACAASVESEFFLHCLHRMRRAGPTSCPLRSSAGVVAESARIVAPSEICTHFCTQFGSVEWFPGPFRELSTEVNLRGTAWLRR